METPLQLHRPESFKHAYQEWKHGPGLYAVQRRVRELFELSIMGEESSDCDIIQTPTYAMFILHSMNDWNTDTYRFLMDYWKELMLDEDYYAYMSDLRNELLDGGIRRQIERHYLKPDVYEAMKNGDIINRRYGNLTLELVLSNREADYLKLTIGYYHERNTHREMGMERLMETLLK